jgi:hypothetical protein
VIREEAVAIHVRKRVRAAGLLAGELENRSIDALGGGVVVPAVAVLAEPLPVVRVAADDVGLVVVGQERRPALTLQSLFIDTGRFESFRSPSGRSRCR